jgi:hypothetical protein
MRGKGAYHRSIERLPEWRLRNLAERGLTAIEICEMIGVSRALVSQKCRRWGITLRSAREREGQ